MCCLDYSVLNGKNMSPTWKMTPLGELTINYDSIRIPIKGSDRKPGGYPYYGASGIVDHIDQFLFDGEFLLVAEDGENLKSRKTPIAFLAKGQFWVNNHAHIIKGNRRAITAFLCYALMQTEITPYLSGSTMPKLTQGNLNLIPIPEPPYEVQEGIVRILSSLDEKIELNRQMNQTLEAMAQAIFQSWFVDFGPVKAKQKAKAAGKSAAEIEMAAIAALSGKSEESIAGLSEEVRSNLGAIAGLFSDDLVESKLGLIPEGWEVEKLQEVCRVINGRAYKNSEFKTEGIPIVRIQNLSGRGTTVYSDLKLEPDKLIESEDLIYAWSATFGPHIWRGEHSIYHYHIWKMEVNETRLSKYLLYKMLERQTGAMRNAGTGSIFTHLTKSSMENLELVVPGKAIADMAKDLLVPMFQKISANYAESKSLAELRDSLLPKLLSGELAIPAAQTQATEVLG
jgi:type I restriction enzyme, S subunit